MANISPIQKKYLHYLLTSDQGSNHQLLTYYLKLILSNRPLELKVPGVPEDQKILKLSPEETWNEINAWKDENGVSLPMGDRGSRKIRATRLLNYLEVVQGSTREAATSYQSMVESVKTTPLQGAHVETPEAALLKKKIDLQRYQIEIHNRQVLGLLSNKLEQTAFLRRFAGDKPTQIALAGLLAANAANLRNGNLPKSVMADEITKLIQLNANRKSGINNASHLAYSNAAQDDELDEISETINEFVQKQYSSDAEFIADTRMISSVSHFLSVSDIPTLINMVAPTANESTRRSLSQALQSSIVMSTSGRHVDGRTILTRALSMAGLPSGKDDVDKLIAITPILEEIRTVELHNTMFGDLKENDPRIQSTLKIASDTQVSAHIPWLNQEDLDDKSKYLEQKYNTKDLASTLEQEFASGKNTEKISEISRHLSNQYQYNLYHANVDKSVSLYWRDKFSKVRGRIASARAPLDRFSQKIDKKMLRLDKFIYSPLYYLSDKLEALKEKNVLWNILTPGEFLAIKYSQGQLWIAGKVLDWSTRKAAEAAAGKRWYAGVFAQISEFSGGFVNAKGDWSVANFNFVQKKWGNLLDWGAKKAGVEAGWQGVKAKVGTALWSGFSKMAPGVAEKLAGGAFGKLVASLVVGELTAGTSLLIQAGLMVVWEAGKGIWKFFTDKNFRIKFFDRLPIILAGLSASLAALPGAIVAGVIAGGSAILAWIGAALSSLFSFIFLPAIIATGSLILAFFLLFQVFQTTIKIDSGISEFIANIICDDSGNTTIPGTTSQNTAPTSSAPSGGVLARAVCLAKYLNQCYGPSVNAGNISKGLSCLASYAVAPSAIAQIEASAAGFVNLQCVGFVKAAVVWGGKSIGNGNACDYVNDPKFVGGLGGVKQGDPIVFRSSGTCSGGAPGHIGIFKEDAGANICLVDANQRCPGCVVDGNCLPKTNVAGYLKL